MGVGRAESSFGFWRRTNQTSTPAAWEAEERKMSTTLRVEMCASLAMAAWMESCAAVRLNWISWL